MNYYELKTYVSLVYSDSYISEAGKLDVKVDSCFIVHPSMISYQSEDDVVKLEENADVQHSSTPRDSSCESSNTLNVFFLSPIHASAPLE
jgi:hypothetical protein